MSEASDSLIFETSSVPEQDDGTITEDQMKEQLVPYIHDLVKDNIDPKDAVEVALAYWNDSHEDYEPVTVDEIKHWFNKEEKPNGTA